MNKINEESDELFEAIERDDHEQIIEELGDLIFSCVNIARTFNISAEYTLDRAVTKFIDRFQRLEKYFHNQNKNLDTLSLEEMDKQWDRIKHEDKNDHN